MWTASAAFLLSATCGAVLTPVVRRAAHRVGALDRAQGSRRVHIAPVPRLGGVAIVLAFYAPLVALLVLESSVGSMLYEQRRQAVGLFAGGLIIAALGVYDDLRGAGSGKKFLVQFAVAGLLWALDYRIERIANPFGDPIPLGAFGLPFTLLWVVGVINALNLIDGLDGLAGGVALFGVVTLFVVALQNGEPLLVLFSAALAGSILGFLFYNFNPASIFMGDTGSMLLGFVLAAASIQTSHKSSTAVAILVPIIALGLPILDTLLAMFRRALRGSPLFLGDREHIHHRLLAAGLTHRQAVLVLYGVCILFTAIALTLTLANSAQTTALLAAFAAIAFLLLRRLGYTAIEPGRVLEDRRRNLATRAQLRLVQERIRRAATAWELWEAVRDAAPLFDAQAARLTLVELPAPGERTTTVFSAGFGRGTAALTTASFPLVPQRPDEGALELGWPPAWRDLDRDTEIAVELLCDSVARRFGDLRAPAGAPPLPGRIVDLPPRA